MRRLLRAMAVDVGLLRRHRDFRLLMGAQAVSLVGTMLTLVALPFQVYAITGSPFAVGALGAVEVIPMVTVALLSGALADAVDRRRQMVAAECLGMAASAALVLNALTAEPSLAVLYVVAAVHAVAYALLRPPMDAMMPRTVGPDELEAAAAITQVQGSLAMAGGPALAGVLLALTGVEVLYAGDFASFALSALLLSRLRVVRTGEPRRVAPLADIRDGLRYAGSRPELIGTYLVDMNAMVFGMPSALFPALAVGWGGPRALGLLFAAPAVGAAVASATSGWAPRVSRQGRAIVLAATGWGAAIVGFGLSDDLCLALGFLALAGAMDAISGLFRSTLWNATIPDDMRGRMAGLEMVSWSSGPGLGNLEAGAVAGLAGVRTSIVSGGVLCVAGSLLLAAAIPKLWRYDARSQRHAPDAVMTP
jgi:MFS family permease